MSRSETYKDKLRNLKKEHTNLLAFLISMSDDMSYEEQCKIIEELSRIQRNLGKIKSMTFNQITKPTNDYYIEIPSKMNTNKFKNLSIIG